MMSITMMVMMIETDRKHVVRLNMCFFALFLLMVFKSTVSLAQVNDFQTWTSIDIRKDFGKDLRGSLKAGQRLKENSLRYDRSLFTASVDVDLNDAIECSGGARYYLVSNRELEVLSRYRLHADASYEKDFRDWSVGCRQRLQYGFDDITSIGTLDENRLKSRSRIGASYHLFGTPFSFESSYEIFVGIDHREGILPVNQRFKIGTEIILSHRVGLELSYLLEDEMNTRDPLTAHILRSTLKYEL